MITPVYAPTATERVLPRLALDFTTASLDARVTVTRALNTATAVNSSGNIAIVNANLPRFDYDPVTKICKGLLVEEQRINVLPYSEQIDNAAWTKTAVTISANGAVAPDGNTTADKIVENTANAQHFINGNYNAQGVAIAYSFYAKAAGRTIVEMGGAGFNGQGNTAKFNLSNGTMYTNTGGKGGIFDAGNGWYRCYIAFTPSTSGNINIFLCDASGANSYTGDGTSGVYIWGIQLEAGTFPSSYIPTTTASVTRNADIVNMTGANFSSWWQATTGGLVTRARQSVITGTRPLAHISDGTANNIISLRGNAANPELYIKATTDQAQIDAGTLVANTSYGLAGAWATDNCAAAINGGAAVTDSSATIPTVDRMLIGSDGTNYLNGWSEKIAFWPQRITNAEIQAFSK